MAMGRIAASEVPVARCWSTPAHSGWSGTIRKPPPTPRSPLARPANAPIAASILTSERLLVSITRVASGEPAHVQVDPLLIFEQILSRAVQPVLAKHEHVCPLRVAQCLARVLLDHEN